MKTNFLLEIAAFTLEGAMVAAGSGAHRIELCDNPNEGGTTPSLGMLKVAKKLISVPIYPIIRPRGGNFVYSNAEFECMKYDIQQCKELGFEGVVLGILTSEGTINTSQTRELVELASPMQVTFHRAFDRCKYPVIALEELIDCGCSRILTSGQFPSAANGLPIIKQLVEQANNRIIIMPGSGLNSKNVRTIILGTGATEFHTAARKAVTTTHSASPVTMNETLSYISADEEEIKMILSELNDLEI